MFLFMFYIKPIYLEFCLYPLYYGEVLYAFLLVFTVHLVQRSQAKIIIIFKKWFCHLTDALIERHLQ